MVSFVTPIHASTGLDKYAEDEPVTAKTINIITS